MLKKVKASIKILKSNRKKSGDGIESQIYGWMKLLFRIQQPAYHGGKLIGKDSVKIMLNGYAMFTHFSGILTRNAKEDFPFTHPMIEELCADFAHLAVLWDREFPLTSKHNPTTDDIGMYKRFVRAAIFTHKAMCLTITHKGHLMWRHVAFAMAVPGGLGKKREDWLEHQHQVGKIIQEYYRRTRNSPQTRAEGVQSEDTGDREQSRDIGQTGQEEGIYLQG